MDNNRDRCDLLSSSSHLSCNNINTEDQGGTVFTPLEFELDDGPTIEALLAAYPNSVVSI